MTFIWKASKKLPIGLLFGYVFLVISATILIRQPFDGMHFQPELFWSWKEWSKQRNQIMLNVIMFIPVGALTGWYSRWRGLWVAFALSLIIETLQLITARGLMEFDDVIHNCLGAAIGIGIVISVRYVVDRCRE